MENKSKELVDDFARFCEQHPEFRFWQALRAWAGFGFLLKADSQDIVSDVWNGIQDTYYFEGKEK